MTRKNWQRIFQTALEDITGLVSPRIIVYCEGKPQPNDSGEEQGLDALVYNEIFEKEFHDALFISGGGDDVIGNLSLALAILSKAFKNVNILQLKDRDDLTDAELKQFVEEAPYKRMLLRREIENYLFDKEILKLYCARESVVFDESKYDEVVNNIDEGNLKPIQQKIKESCSFRGSVKDLKIKLATCISSDTAIYKELKDCIFI